MLWRPPLESKRMYFQDYDYAVRSGAEKMYQALPSSPTSKILKSNRSNRKREYTARTQFDCSNHRQPKRTMCGFGLQRSFGRNILELLVYYLMLNKCKNLKDMKSSCLSVCTIAFMITKDDISCIITCDSGP